MRRISIQGAIEPAVPLDLFGDWIADGLFTPANSFTRALDEAAAAGEDIEVWINSPGGSVDAANEMLAAFQDFKGYKCVTVGGLAASAAAFFVLQCGARVECHENSRFMFHSARTWLDGGPGALRDTATAIDQINEPVMARLKALGMDPARVDEGFQDDRTLWIAAKEAHDLGIVQKVLKGAAPVPAAPTSERLAGLPQGYAALADSLTIAMKGTADMAEPIEPPAPAADPEPAPAPAPEPAPEDPAPAPDPAPADDSPVAALGAKIDALVADRDAWRARAEKAEADFAVAKVEAGNLRADIDVLVGQLDAEKKARASIVGGALLPAASPAPLSRDAARAALAALPPNQRAEYYKAHKAEIG